MKNKDWFALTDAVKSKDINLLKAALVSSANPNITRGMGREHYGWLTPLHLACADNFSEAVILLLESGADPNGLAYGNTPLVIAAENEVISGLLLRAGAEPNIFYHAIHCNAEGIERFRSQTGFPMIRDEFDCTPLHYACENPDPSFISFLITEGHDVNCYDLRRNYPIHFLTGRGHYDPTKVFHGSTWNDSFSLLIESGADVNQKNWRRVTPLHNACRVGNFALVALLLEAGAQINAVDISGKTALDRCAGNRGLSELSEFLIRQGAIQGKKTSEKKKSLPRGSSMKRIVGRPKR